MAKHLGAGIEKIDMAQTVIAAMLTLPDEQWIILFHRFYNGLTQTETARIVDRSLDKTRQLEARALFSLRQPKVSKLLRDYL